MATDRGCGKPAVVNRPGGLKEPNGGGEILGLFDKPERTGDRRERAAVMDGRTKTIERGKMLGHAVPHVALEPVARMREATSGL